MRPRGSSSALDGTRSSGWTTCPSTPSGCRACALRCGAAAPACRESHTLAAVVAGELAEGLGHERGKTAPFRRVRRLGQAQVHLREQRSGGHGRLGRARHVAGTAGVLQDDEGVQAARQGLQPLSQPQRRQSSAPRHSATAASGAGGLPRTRTSLRARTQVSTCSSTKSTLSTARLATRAAPFASCRCTNFSRRSSASPRRSTQGRWTCPTASSSC